MHHLDLNTNDSGELFAGHDVPTANGLGEPQADAAAASETGPEAHLAILLRALLSFFDTGNHPFAGAEQTGFLKQNFVNDLRVARTVLWDCSRLTFQLAGAETTADELFIEANGAASSGGFSLSEESGASAVAVTADDALLQLAEVLCNFCLLSDELLATGSVSLSVWSNVGKLLTRDLERSEAVKRLLRDGGQRTAASLEMRLASLAQTAPVERSFAADLLIIFSRMARMLEWLGVVESYLRRDVPLKQSLPIFTLVNQETQELRRFVENRTLRLHGLDAAISDVLEGTSYALAMELRKVFSRELIGLSALRHPPTIYARVETACGILRDSFQQSIVALAQLFDPTLDGSALFTAYRTRKEQSLVLRHDLWMLLQLIQRAEQERDRHPLVLLLERLTVFQQGSLRYLMYKDWEACERFIEEVGAARGAIELSPVLHRFAAFIETLFNQVSMRAVLSDAPFDFPSLEK